ncbi:exosome complex component MTR3 [Culicoides brevitarsis]|uniref:exosome complex component MTR3 n=1 Tax=Culicoides brevitarsis TaxID=469753 RepID=UPI00307BC292
MPVDHKRINGPEASLSYKLYSVDYLKALEKEIERTDRGNEEPRKIFLESGILSNARGSAYIEMGNTKVTVAVFDPREIPKNNKHREEGILYCYFKFASFSCAKRKLPQPDSDEKSYALALKRALQPAVCRYTFPNFQVDVFVNVLENDGSALAAAITAAGLALADAGIPMYDVITGACIGIKDDKMFVDPTANEEEICSLVGKTHGTMTVARLSKLEQISEIYQAGCLSLEAIEKALEMLKSVNEEIAPLVQQIIVKKVAKQVKANKLEQEKMDVTEIKDEKD